jgi:uncharacterized protein
MKKMLGSLSLFLLINQSAYSASYDCSKATAVTDITVCKDSILSDLDKRVVSLYSSAKQIDINAANKVRNDSYKEKMSCGDDRRCISSAYARASFGYFQILDKSKNSQKDEDQSSSFITPLDGQNNNSVSKVANQSDEAILLNRNEVINTESHGQRYEENKRRIREETERYEASQNLEKRRKEERLLAEQREQKLRQQCLGNGQIGICQSASQNNSQFLCGQNSITALNNLFNEYCYTTDTLHVTTSLEVRNNTNKTVKDITFVCTQFAKSGTALARNNSVIYDLWKPGEIKSLTMKFFKHEQIHSMDCKAVNWK